jgi:hypothetical protein
MPTHGISLEFSESDNPAWHLRIQAEATSEDLEQNGYLEYEGQPIWVTEVEVRCCPYCGEQLPGTLEAERLEYGNYWHTDLAKL